MAVTKILGIVKAIHVGASAPANVQMLWFDTNVNLHKYYDTGGSSWVNLASGGASLNTVLTAGPDTLGQIINVSPGDAITFENAGFKARVETGVLTANRIIQWQDKDGTVALLSDIAGAGNLAAVLTLGNATGANDIQVDAGQFIKAAAGPAVLDMNQGGSNKFMLSAYGIAGVPSAGYVRADAGYLELGTGDGAATSKIILDNTATGIITMTTAGDITFTSTVDNIVLAPNKGVGIGTALPQQGSVEINLGLYGGAATATRMALYRDGITDPASYDMYLGGTTRSATLEQTSFGALELTNLHDNRSVTLRATTAAVLSSFFEAEGATGNNISHKTMRFLEDYRVRATTMTVDATTFPMADRTWMRYDLAIPGPTSLDDITGGQQGQVIHITATTIGLTLKHNTGGVGTKIMCPGGVDYVIPQYGGATLIFDGIGPNAWIVVDK